MAGSLIFLYHYAMRNTLQVAAWMLLIAGITWSLISALGLLFAPGTAPRMVLLLRLGYAFGGLVVWTLLNYIARKWT